MSDQMEVPAVPAVAVKAPKSKKPKAAGVKTPTYQEMIAGAITGLNKKSGSSRQVIVANFEVLQEKAGGYILKSLKKGVSKGVFKSAKESGKGAGKYKLVVVAPKKAKPAKKKLAKKVVAIKKLAKKNLAKKSSSKKTAKKWFKQVKVRPIVKESVMVLSLQ